MRPYANMPVVFQPIDSGWNSCLRDDGRDVAFLQCGFERDVAFSDILHFKTFQLQIQQMQTKLDVDLVLQVASFLARLLSR